MIHSLLATTGKLDVEYRFGLCPRASLLWRGQNEAVGEGVLGEEEPSAMIPVKGMEVKYSLSGT